MIVARAGRGQAPQDFDVVVIGAGFAGLAVARSLVDRGLRVALVERGPVDPAHAVAPSDVGTVDGGRLDLAGSRKWALGGTSTWAGQCIRLEPGDLSGRPGIPGSAWPIGEDELTQWYEQAEDLFDVRGQPTDERPLTARGLQAPRFPAGTVVTRATVYTARLDWAAGYRDWLAQEPLVSLFPETTALILSAGDAPGVVRTVSVRGPDGNRWELSARAFAVCTGGVENARLLLSSAQADPSGPFNPGDNVGRYFQEHPSVLVGELHPWSTQAVEVYSLVHDRGYRWWPKLTLTPEAQKEARCLGASVALQKTFAAGSAVEHAREISRLGRSAPLSLLRHVTGLASHPLAAVDLARRRHSGRSPVREVTRVDLLVQLEQEPRRENRVLLAGREDVSGVPLPRIEWGLGDLDLRTIRAAAQTAAFALREAGLGEARLHPWVGGAEDVEPPVIGEAYHHIGTTRMGPSAEDSVVDADCRVHGTSNLYLGGSSVFRTSSWVNPTLTIVALALRMAEALARDNGAR